MYLNAYSLHYFCLWTCAELPSEYWTQHFIRGLILAHTSAVLTLPPSPHFSLHFVYLWASFASRNKQKFKYRVFSVFVHAVPSSLSLTFIHICITILLAECMKLGGNLMNYLLSVYLSPLPSVKQPGPDVLHSPQFRAKVKNEWSYCCITSVNRQRQHFNLLENMKSILNPKIVFRI